MSFQAYLDNIQAKTRKTPARKVGMNKTYLRLGSGLAWTLVGIGLPSFGLAEPKPPATKLKPDLVCSISVSKNADRSDAVTGGGTLSYSDPKSKFSVYVAVTNQGKANAVDITVQGALWNGTNDLAGAFTKKDSQVPPGESVDVVAMQFAFGARGDHYKVTAQIDKANVVDESNESNNACEIEFDTKRGGDTKKR